MHANVKVVITSFSQFCFIGYERYCRLRSDVLQYVPFPDIVVYLNAGPQECHKRIVERGRVIDLCSLTI
jgi:deoxyadenosine/deoxycytidine kinase